MSNPATRNRDEPTQIMQAAASALTVDEAAAGYERVFNADPGSCFQAGTCRHCGASLGTSTDDMVIPLGAFGFLPNTCCQPCAEAGKKRIVDEERKARAGMLAGIIPDDFLWWDEGRGNNAARARALGAFNMDNRRGMILHGTSGTCKTRLLWEMVKKVVESPNSPSWAFVDAYDAATAGFPADAARADFLFLDDLGNEPTSTKYETALLRLIRKRNDWHKPVFISTQLTGLVFKKRFFEGAAAEAILRRLNERTDKITTDEAQRKAA